MRLAELSQSIGVDVPPTEMDTWVNTLVLDAVREEASEVPTEVLHTDGFATPRSEVEANGVDTPLAVSSGVASVVSNADRGRA